MTIRIGRIDSGHAFDFGRTAHDYAKYRDIYPGSLYDKLKLFGVVRPEMKILDVGTGTGVLPRKLCTSGAEFTGIDLAPEQILQARRLSEGLGIAYEVSAAEATPFAEQSFDAVTACQCFRYFDAARFAAELTRILKPAGLFAEIAMEWLPGEDPVAKMTEELVLEYNPAWSGGGFRPRPYRFPAWAEGSFALETLHCYRESLPFTIESWCGRIRSCRGVGASLPPEQVEQFDRALRERLREDAGESFSIAHHLRLEIYRLIR